MVWSAETDNQGKVGYLEKDLLAKRNRVVLKSYETLLNIKMVVRRK